MRIYVDVLAIDEFHEASAGRLVDDERQGCLRIVTNPVNGGSSRNCCIGCRTRLIRRIGETSHREGKSHCLLLGTSQLKELSTLVS